MNPIWKQPSTTVRHKELEWLNGINQMHDLFCHCKNPTTHLLYCINKFSGVQKPLEDIKNIQCLLTGDRTGETTEEKHIKDDGGFLDGELEDLFKEDTDAENPQNTTQELR